MTGSHREQIRLPDRSNMKKRALIAMSGGVDSSAAALIMQQRGYECVGMTMRLFPDGDPQTAADRACCASDDAEDARRIAEKLDMPFYVCDFTDRFRRDVIDRFADAYELGRTPNPCIDCNRYLKFGALLRKADELGCEHIVTGHYARVQYDARSGRYLLKKGADRKKDQSYVLYTLTQEQLARVIFPLGEMEKSGIRRMAADAGFANAEKAESQDICFVKDGKYADFLEDYRGAKYPEGDFVFPDGTVAGRHRGIVRYTVGQRKGLGLALRKPAYVCAIEPQTNIVRLGDSEDLFSRVVLAEDVNLIAADEIEDGMRVKARIRYHQPECAATVTQTGPHSLRLVFDEPQRAVTPGQSLVMYQDDVVVGGGIITGTK